MNKSKTVILVIGLVMALIVPVNAERTVTKSILVPDRKQISAHKMKDFARFHFYDIKCNGNIQKELVDKQQNEVLKLKEEEKGDEVQTYKTYAESMIKYMGIWKSEGLRRDQSKTQFCRNIRKQIKKDNKLRKKVRTAILP